MQFGDSLSTLIDLGSGGQCFFIPAQPIEKILDVIEKLSCIRAELEYVLLRMRPGRHRELTQDLLDQNEVAIRSLQKFSTILSETRKRRKTRS